ncbi:MAG: hypothetical protein AAGH90_00875 [Pseudomonadota bacterium]
MSTADQEIKNPSVLPATLALFTSLGTLICCALPAMLVLAGMGAVWAGVLKAIPGITFFGENKALVFGVTASVLIASGAWQWHARNLPCPTDPAKARACSRLRRLSWTLWGVSVLAFSVGGFFAFFPGIAADLFL